jgi:tRNA (Thr-GGU) A37 N-methylase
MRKPKEDNMATVNIVFFPIAWVHSHENGLRKTFWGEIISEIRLDRKRFSADALKGLAAFSHVEVLFHLHAVGEASIVRGIAPSPSRACVARRHTTGGVRG